MFHRVKSETQNNKEEHSREVVQDNRVEKQAFNNRGPLTGKIQGLTGTASGDLQESSPSESVSRQEQSQEQSEERISVQKSDVRETHTQGSDSVTHHNPQNNPQKQKEAKEMSQTETQTPASERTEAQAEIPSSSYQRVGASPASVGGYPGSSSSYPGYGAAAQASTSSDRRLTIGAGITMSGEIEACDYLLVEGTVEAALKGASVLDVAETGIFYGTVEIEDATIAGRFEGDITAHGRLTLREGAIVTGTIAYKELEIEAGAVIDGKLTPLSAVGSARASTPESEAAPARPAAKKDAAKPAAAKDVKEPGDVTPAPANSDTGLFSKATTAAE